MIKDKKFISMLIIVILFSMLVFFKVSQRRNFNFDFNNHMISIVLCVDKPLTLNYGDLTGEKVYRSGVESEGEIVRVEKVQDEYRVIAKIPVTQSGPYMKFGSQPVKMGYPLIIEGNLFYFEGVITYIEVGDKDEK